MWLKEARMYQLVRQSGEEADSWETKELEAVLHSANWPKPTTRLHHERSSRTQDARRSGGRPHVRQPRSQKNTSCSGVLHHSLARFGSIGVLFELEPNGVTRAALAIFDVHPQSHAARLFTTRNSLSAKQRVITACTCQVNPCRYHRFHKRGHKFRRFAQLVQAATLQAALLAST